jgi:PleD family two-component response regulator
LLIFLKTERRVFLPRPPTTKLRDYGDRSCTLSEAPRILFVDDHEDTRYLITHLLGAQGYEVAAAASVEEGPSPPRSEF